MSRHLFWAAGIAILTVVIFGFVGAIGEMRALDELERLPLPAAVKLP